MDSFWLRLLLIGLCTLLFVLLRQLAGAAMRRVAASKGVSDFGQAFALRAVNTLLLLVFALVTLGLLGLELNDVEVLLSSVFAVVGVAFFAQWSILSNITASAIIFFSFPYRVGDWVQVLEKDMDIQGVIEDISLFHVLIRNLHNELVTYPNNLILQKPVLRLAGRPQWALPKDMADELVPFAVGETICVRDGQSEITGSILFKNAQRLVLAQASGATSVIPASRLSQCILSRDPATGQSAQA